MRPIAVALAAAALSLAGYADGSRASRLLPVALAPGWG